EVGIGVFAFHDGGEAAGVDFAIRFGGGRYMLRRFDDGNRSGRVLGEADFGAGFGVSADGLDPAAVGDQRVMTDLVDARGWKFQAGCGTAVTVADVDEGTHLVEGHEVMDAIGEM